MNTNRLDGWTLEEEKILADIILTTLKNGGTQMSAFLEAGQKLKRTPTACGHRWNRVLRKQYVSKIEDAKAAWRMNHVNTTPDHSLNHHEALSSQNELTTKEIETKDQMDSVSNMLLAEMYEMRQLIKQEINEQVRLSNEIASLRDELQTLTKQIEKSQESAHFFIQIIELICNQVLIRNKSV